MDSKTRTPVLYIQRMRTDKKKAEELRNMGMSYEEIARTMSIPKSTLSAWFSGSDWSQKIKKELEVIAR